MIYDRFKKAFLISYRCHSFKVDGYFSIRERKPIISYSIVVFLCNSYLSVDKQSSIVCTVPTIIVKRTTNPERAFPPDFELDLERDFERELEPPRWADAEMRRNEIMIMINR
jgi:hypothetical protein